MSFSPITHLRHVDLAVPDYNVQVAFYKDHWGLTPVGSDSGVTYFAAEGSPEQYIVRVRNAQDKRIDLVLVRRGGPDSRRRPRPAARQHRGHPGQRTG